jgi:hypothetical protein
MLLLHKYSLKILSVQRLIEYSMFVCNYINFYVFTNKHLPKKFNDVHKNKKNKKSLLHILLSTINFICYEFS